MRGNECSISQLRRVEDIAVAGVDNAILQLVGLLPLLPDWCDFANRTPACDTVMLHIDGRLNSLLETASASDTL